MLGDVLEAIEQLEGKAIPIELGKHYVWDEAALNLRYNPDDAMPYRITCATGNFSFGESHLASDFIEEYVNSDEFEWISEVYKSIRVTYGNCRWIGTCWTAKFKHDIIEFWVGITPGKANKSTLLARVAKPSSGIPTSASVVPAKDFKDPVGDFQTVAVKLGMTR